jgi:hypothetical protein
MFYKAPVIGTRLYIAVVIANIVMTFYLLFIKWISKSPIDQLPAKGMGVKILSEAWT